MKVLHITNNYPTNAFPIFGIFVKEQIDSLSEIGIENDVFFINGRERGKIEYLKAIKRLKTHMKSNSYDIIHCHHVYSSLVLIMSGFHRTVPSVVSFQNDPTKETKLNLFSIVKDRVDAWIFKNNSSLVDNERGFYLPNGVNLDFFRSIPREEALHALGLDSKKKYILFVSSNFVRQQKRYDIFKRVVEELQKSDPDIQELQMINVPRDLVPYYFNAASVHLLTSDFEGSPNSVKEAMSCNIPVVSTDVGNVKEMLEGIEGTYVSDSNNVDELSTLVKEALSQKDLQIRNMFMQKGLDKKSIAQKLKNIYNKIINN